MSISFYADSSMPGQEETAEGYMNLDTWAQYTYDDLTVNHGVCIVGWDDTISKEMFNSDPAKQPPAGGAWIVKNSWGSETDYVVNESGVDITKNDWGIVDENGKHTGYFWISYYDKTLNSCETMTFDTYLDKENEILGVWVYDYMPAVMKDSWTRQSKARA